MIWLHLRQRRRALPTTRIKFLLAVAVAVVSDCSPLPDKQASRGAGQPATGLPRRQPDIHFLPTPYPAVDAMLQLAGVGPNDVVYDLGSGDGRIVIAAASTYGARGVGIELDPKLVAEATRNAQMAGVADRVTFREGDIFEADISEATVVTLFLLSTINDRLLPKLMRELNPGTRVVSYRFPIRDWEPEKEIVVANQDVFFWTVPAPGSR
jgi:SAM-dependent methyltransferase